MSGSSDRVELVEHDPSWAELFEAEKSRIGAIFDGRAVGIEHVGSTSVPDLCAKPIVDVLVGLRDLELSDEQVAAMEQLGYHYLGEHGLAGRLFFRKEPRTHHVHVVEHGGDHWERQLIFRDALRSDSEERQRYDEFKRKLAAEGHPREVYTELKTPFIRDVEARAKARGVRPSEADGHAG
ncbi:MAG: GrpB family protein [Actinomycetota bacterium]|nr:GrpB family protein [Actinomycetota bacterium]